MCIFLLCFVSVVNSMLFFARCSFQAFYDPLLSLLSQKHSIETKWMARCRPFSFYFLSIHKHLLCTKPHISHVCIKTHIQYIGPAHHPAAAAANAVVVAVVVVVVVVATTMPHHQQQTVPNDTFAGSLNGCHGKSKKHKNTKHKLCI